MSEDTWYFAYGSNMSIARKEQRTDKIRRALRSRLDGYRLAFNKAAAGGGVYANIVPDESCEVWGVLYLCNAEAMNILDGCEGVTGGHYERIMIEVENSDSERIECATYVAGADYICEEGKPSVEYLQHILNGARDHDLPGWYIESIRKLAKRHR
jgi:gamma-glutamylcyclotransferase (GGCT)/AIG2-like uncharacterized protein YtfP